MSLIVLELVDVCNNTLQICYLRMYVSLLTLFIIRTNNNPPNKQINKRLRTNTKK